MVFTMFTLSLRLAYHFTAPDFNSKILFSFSVGKMRNRTYKQTSSMKFRISPPLYKVPSPLSPPLSLSIKSFSPLSPPPMLFGKNSPPGSLIQKLRYDKKYVDILPDIFLNLWPIIKTKYLTTACKDSKIYSKLKVS